MHYLIVGVTRLLRLLSDKAAVKVGLAIGFLLRRIFKFRYEIIYSQIKRSLGEGKSEADLQALIKKIYRHLGLTVIEILRLPGISEEEIRNKVKFHGDEYVDEGYRDGKGVLALCGHIGNWELMGIAWAKHYSDRSINSLAKQMKTRSGNLLLKLFRGDNGVNTIAKSNSIKEILKRLRNNEAVAFVLDQNTATKEGVFVDFFGKPACTMPALSVIAERTGAAILPMYIYRDDDLIHHHVVVYPRIELERKYDNAQENTVHNTERFTKILENMIRDHPDQWLWIHKRWRSQLRQTNES